MSSKNREEKEAWDTPEIVLNNTFMINLWIVPSSILHFISKNIPDTWKCLWESAAHYLRSPKIYFSQSNIFLFSFQSSFSCEHHQTDWGGGVPWVSLGSVSVFSSELPNHRTTHPSDCYQSYFVNQWETEECKWKVHFCSFWPGYGAGWLCETKTASDPCLG